VVTAQVRGSGQRPDKRGKMPRELPSPVLSLGSISIRRTISHALSLSA
jgi:hypothetical protein